MNAYLIVLILSVALSVWFCWVSNMFNDERTRFWFVFVSCVFSVVSFALVLKGVFGL